MAVEQETADPTCGCEGAGMSRRRFLGTAGAAAALGVLGGAGSELSSTRYAFAAPGGYSGDVLVVLSLRGGFDGLSAIVPGADPHLRAARPGIGVPAASLLSLDGTFGMHPALAPLKPLWDSGMLAAVHAAGQIDPSRSHFQAMQELERAAPGSGIRTGWLDRVSGAAGAGSAFATVGVGIDAGPASLIGPAPELLMSSLEGFSLAGADNETERARWNTALRAMHAGARPEIRGPALTTLGALATAAAIRSTTYVPGNGAVYPDNPLGKSLRDVAQLTKAGVGLRVATVDYGDWDMHVGVGGVGGGWMTNQLGELAAALAAFAADLGDRMGAVTLVTLSEFGRRVDENASGGLDHGHGNVMLLMGGGVVGGRMHGAWPGLAPAALVDGALPAANDYRTVLAEVLEQRCGISGSSVFPGLGSRRLGVARPR